MTLVYFKMAISPFSRKNYQSGYICRSSEKSSSIRGVVVSSSLWLALNFVFLRGKGLLKGDVFVLKEIGENTFF